MDDINEFFAEQEKRMNLPDEDIDEYIRSRMQGFHKESGVQGWSKEDTPGGDNSIQTLDPCPPASREGNSIMHISDTPQDETSFGMTSTTSGHTLWLPGQLKRKSPQALEIARYEKRTEKARNRSASHLMTPNLFTSFPRNEHPGLIINAPDVTWAAKRTPADIDSNSEMVFDHFTGNVVRNRMVPSAYASRSTRALHSSAVHVPILRDSPGNVNGTTRRGQDSHRDGQANVGCSTDPDLEGDSSLVSAASDPAKNKVVSRAMPVVEEFCRSSNHATVCGSRSRVVKTAKNVGVENSTATTPGNHSVIGAFSLSQNASSSKAAVPGPIGTIHGNGRDRHPNDSADVLDHQSRLSPAGFAPQFVSSPAAQPVPDVSPSPRSASDTDDLNGPRDEAAPKIWARLQLESHANVSSITSFGTTPPRHLKRAVSEASDIEAPSSPGSPDQARQKLRRTVSSTRGIKGTSSIAKGVKKTKEKTKLVTPLEYAQKLQSILDVPVPRKTSYLKGKHIFYVGGDMQYASTKTRGRMDFIVKYGGTLVPTYDSTIVTHIVTDASARPTLRALSLRSLSEIPDHIPTVTWNWVISGFGRATKGKGRTNEDTKDKGEANAANRNDEQDNEALNLDFLYAAFPERINAGRSWQQSSNRQGKCKEALECDHTSGMASIKSSHHDSGDLSRISDFTPKNQSMKGTERAYSCLTVLPPPPLNLRSTDGYTRTKKAISGPSEVKRTKRTSPVCGNGTEDPLAEYYAFAKAEHDAAWKHDESDSDADEGLEIHRGPAPKRGFTCDRNEPQQSACANQDIVDKLEELMELHKAKPSEEDRWRAFSYGKCIHALRNYPKQIRSFSEARSIRGVGEKTALKASSFRNSLDCAIKGDVQIMEIIETGSLKRITYENTEDVEATKVFQGIYGVGRQTAFAWFSSGLRTLDDVKSRKGGLKLSAVQEIGLTFYDDINSRMPRIEAEMIFNLIKPIALSIDNSLFIEIMGSFRRGKADCGDIDILITRPTSDGRTHQGLLPALLEHLHAANILTEDLAIPDNFADLELTYRGLCKLPSPDAKRRRIDILCVPWESRGAALLYYTGDDIFNRAMRMKANVLGYSLNQRGLYAGVVRDPRDRRVKVCDGTIIASETEQEIFQILGVPWQKPRERIRD
ncbi:hypothetical protein HYDPIDRAFT_42398 [Hydnomerulius pinastri MD-312]|uniref:DNA polymerase lambda n=1 Tax=Hydnomerulius pinastri MD-312 TaxID=994086 RepID=A0A0C9WC26_9AGAM|nr:hypothetical protein HYDPIDRAFT_42398 [Hydnomerulius pinastri MD-312]